MIGEPLVRIKAVTAAEVCAHFDLEEEARPLLRQGMGPREFVHALVAHKQYAAGIDFMAHALAAREAVWWGCLCLQHACGSKLAGPDKAAAASATAVKFAAIKVEPARIADTQRLFVELGMAVAEGRYLW